MATENQCETCRIILLDQQELEEHQALKHWKCPKCSTQCNSLQALLSHQMFDHSDEQWLKECSHCDFISNPRTVLAHELEKHSETDDKTDNNDESFEEGNLVIDEQDPLAIDDQENIENIPPENDLQTAKHILPDVPMDEPKKFLPNSLAKKTLPVFVSKSVTPIAVVPPVVAQKPVPVVAVIPSVAEEKSVPEIVRVENNAKLDIPAVLRTENSEVQNNAKVGEPIAPESGAVKPMEIDLPNELIYR